MNERVRWFTNNQNVVRIVQHGSGKPALQVEALGIFSLCVNNHIRIEPEWIPREENELADYYSRMVDYDDWMLNPEVFNWLDTIWGPILLIDSQVQRMLKLNGSIPGTGQLVQRL